MLVYLAGPQTFLHLCKISDKVNIYLVQVRDVGRSENREGGRVVWLGQHLGGRTSPLPPRFRHPCLYVASHMFLELRHYLNSFFFKNLEKLT